MLGTLVNVATVVVGTTIGVILKSRLPEKLVKTVFQALGLFTLVLGIIMAIKTTSFLLVVFSLVFGTMFGEWADIEVGMEKLSNKLKSKINIGGESFSDGLLTAFLLFCTGSLTILGAIDEGMKGDPTLLITKSVMDGFTSMALASALGIGVGFSVIPMFIFQGGLTLFAAYLGDFFTPIIVSELTAVGGILLVGLGINVLEIKKIKIFNMLPALLLIVLFTWLNGYFNLGL